MLSKREIYRKTQSKTRRKEPKDLVFKETVRNFEKRVEREFSFF